MRYITEDLADRISVLVVGKPGIGKTSLLRTIPPEESVCTLSAESGLLSVRDMIRNGQVQGVVIDSFETFEECFGYLKNDQSWKDEYKWVFVDSLTEIGELCFKHAKSLHPSGKKETYNIWNTYGEKFIDIIKGFRDLTDYNVVLTALETFDFNENKERFIYPSIPWKELQKKLPGYFDEVMYMTFIVDEKGNYQRVFYTQPYDNYPSKDRSGALDLLEPPDLANIKAKILTRKD
jgi:hypothetical protein